MHYQFNRAARNIDVRRQKRIDSTDTFIDASPAPEKRCLLPKNGKNVKI